MCVRFRHRKKKKKQGENISFSQAKAKCVKETKLRFASTKRDARKMSNRAKSNCACNGYVQREKKILLLLLLLCGQFRLLIHFLATFKVSR